MEQDISIAAIQEDVGFFVNSDEMFANINVQLERNELYSSEVALATVWLTPKGGASGIGVVVAMPKLNVQAPNGPLEFVCRQRLSVLEEPNINQNATPDANGNTGTQIFAEDVGAYLVLLLHEYGLSQNITLYAEGEVMVPNREYAGIRGVDIDLNYKFTPAQLTRCATVPISFADDECTLTCATEGATILYTTDGSFPGQANDPSGAANSATNGFAHSQPVILLGVTNLQSGVALAGTFSGSLATTNGAGLVNSNSTVLGPITWTNGASLAPLVGGLIFNGVFGNAGGSSYFSGNAEGLTNLGIVNIAGAPTIAGGGNPLFSSGPTGGAAALTNFVAQQAAVAMGNIAQAMTPDTILNKMNIAGTSIGSTSVFGIRLQGSGLALVNSYYTTNAAGADFMNGNGAEVIYSSMTGYSTVLTNGVATGFQLPGQSYGGAYNSYVAWGDNSSLTSLTPPVSSWYDVIDNTGLLQSNMTASGSFAGNGSGLTAVNALVATNALAMYGVTPEQFGAFADTQTRYDVTITAGSQIISSTYGGFSAAADVGKFACVYTNQFNTNSFTSMVIAVPTPNELELSNQAPVSCSLPVEMHWGHDNSVAFDNTFAYMLANNVQNCFGTNGCYGFYLPPTLSGTNHTLGQWVYSIVQIATGNIYHSYSTTTNQQFINFQGIGQAFESQSGYFGAQEQTNLGTMIFIGAQGMDNKNGSCEDYWVSTSGANGLFSPVNVTFRSLHIYHSCWPTIGAIDANCGGPFHLLDSTIIYDAYNFATSIGDAPSLQGMGQGGSNCFQVFLPNTSNNGDNVLSHDDIELGWGGVFLADHAYIDGTTKIARFLNAAVIAQGTGLTFGGTEFDVNFTNILAGYAGQSYGAIEGTVRFLRDDTTPGHGTITALNNSAVLLGQIIVHDQNANDFDLVQGGVHASLPSSTFNLLVASDTVMNPTNTYAGIIGGLIKAPNGFWSGFRADQEASQNQYPLIFGGNYTQWPNSAAGGIVNDAYYGGIYFTEIPTPLASSSRGFLFYEGSEGNPLATKVFQVDSSGNVLMQGSAQIHGMLNATNSPVNGYALRYTNGNLYWGP